MNRRNLIIAAGVALIIVAAALTRCRNSDASAFQASTVTRGPITQAVTATGTLNPVVNVQVGSQVSGNIQKLFADYNSSVKAGETVAQIDPATFQAAVTQAEGDFASAQAQLELARVNAKRTQELFAKQNSAQADVDLATANLHQAEAAVKIKQGALDKVRADLDHCTITSPIDGTVISRSVDVGQTVAASLQAPIIFTIANDLAKMQIDSNVAEADVGVVKVDQDVDFTVDAFPNQIFHGKVVQVRNAPITVQNVVTYDTVIGVSNADLKLKPGMTANVSIVIAQRDDVLKVSNAALRFRLEGATPAPEKKSSPSKSGSRDASAQQRRSGERTVYVLQGSQPRAVQIKTGISDGITTEVLEGLKEGDKIVTAKIGGPAAQAPAPNPFSGGQQRRF